MIINTILALVAYAAIITAIVIFVKGARLENNSCNQDCNQGRKCDCEKQE